MDEVTSGLDPDDLMDLDEAEGSDLEDEEEDNIDDPIPSPLQLPSSGPGSTATSTASSPPNNDDAPSVFNFSGKPLNIKRGRGRPRREGCEYIFILVYFMIFATLLHYKNIW